MNRSLLAAPSFEYQVVHHPECGENLEHRSDFKDRPQEDLKVCLERKLSFINFKILRILLKYTKLIHFCFLINW